MLYAHEELISKLRGVLSGETIELIRERLEHSRIEEIRIRRSKRVQIIYNGGEALLDEVPDDTACARLLENLCDHSVYTRTEEMRNGFLTIKGGCRIGICGHVVTEHGEIARLTDINGFSIRIAREIKGCADALVPQIIDNGRAVSTLLISAPGIGKTTMLRDIARQLSDGRNGAKPHRVCIADERGELAAVNDGEAWLDTGERSDVIDMCKKADAMRLFIRSMSPQVIVTDEIGDSDDTEALYDAARCGISVVASLHADSIGDVMSRESTNCLVCDGCFKNVIRLYRRNGQVLFEKAR